MQNNIMNSMDCPPMSCPVALKPTEYPKKCSASDYIKAKKDKAMTIKYTKTGYPTTYPHYSFRNDILWGKALNVIEQCGPPCAPACGTWYVCNPKSNALVI
jgi:hypothetical protein